MKAPYPRFRERHNRSVSLLKAVQISAGSKAGGLPGTIIYPDDVCPSGGTSETMFDIVVPEYTKRIANGEIVNNAMEYSKSVLTWGSVVQTMTNTYPLDDVGYLRIILTGYLGAQIDKYDTPVAGNVLMRENILKYAISQDEVAHLAGVKARNEISNIDVQSLVTLAELHKTVALIADVASSLAKFVRGITTGNLPMILQAIGGGRTGRGGSSRNSASKRMADNASSRWLQYRYGVIPLVMDVQGAFKALRKLPPEPRRTARGFATRSLHRDWLLQRNRNASAEGVEEYTFTFNQEVKARAYCLITAEVTYQSARDFGVTEFPLAVWELVPFSFIYDWFFTVGKWLEAVTPKVGIKILAEGVMIKSDRFLLRNLTDWEISPTLTFPRWARSGHLGMIDSLSLVEKHRIPSLTPYLRFPIFDVNLNVKRAVDAVALFVTAGRQSGIRT